MSNLERPEVEYQPPRAAAQRGYFLKVMRRPATYRPVEVPHGKHREKTLGMRHPGANTLSVTSANPFSPLGLCKCQSIIFPVFIGSASIILLNLLITRFFPRASLRHLGLCLNLTHLTSSSIPLAGPGPSIVHPVRGGSERSPIPIGLDLKLW